MRSCLLRAAAIANRFFMLVLVALISAGAIFAQAQATAADLVGTVVDPSEAIVPGATVTVRNAATGISRTATASDSGEYQILGLPPGTYEISAEAANFSRTVINSVTLTIGQRAELQIKLALGAQSATVNIDGSAVELVETTRTAVANTIDQRRIENLPINERSATGFALTISTVGRDNGRPIGPAPTSGLNIGGQRGRSTLLQVDGADFTDNSVNAARSTVSQEAVQEFQVATNSYLPEFGRATGGVVNVVTKRGTNEFHGNVFGYIRDKNIQARNAFAPVDKPDFRRTQYGVTFGGPLATDRTFFFFAWEGRRRDESGFFTSNVAQDLTSAVTVGAPFLPFSQTFNNITPQQATWANGALTQARALLGSPATAAAGQQLASAAVGYLYLASGGSNTALTGTNPLLSPGGTSTPITAGQTVGSRFFLTGAPVPVSDIAFRPLNNLQKVFPVTDRTNFYSIRGDHNIDENNQFTIRFGYNPSTISGIQVESQNQSLGQNDFSRTGVAKITDASFSTGLNSTLSANLANEFRFNFGKRKTLFRSQNGDAVAYNIAGTAFIGRELFSPVDRQENRFQLADNLNFVAGNHTMKFGADFNFVTIPQARFELNFAGLFNFGNLAYGDLNPAAASLGAPDFTPVQTYGLGLPSNFIQGFGNPISQINNKPIAFFAQDTWKLFKNFTVNYGVRYDVELTDTIAPVGFIDPLSGINLSAANVLAAQDAIGVQQGLPRDTNNIAPRLAFAWDIFNNQKTVFRGAIGTFYDHPLLAVAFNSDIADDAQQQQAVLTQAGGPTPTALLNATQVFQGTVCGPAFTNPLCAAGVRTPGLAPTAQYQFGRQRFNDQTFIGYSSVLPFSLPIAKDFQYASATQANVAIEQQIGRDMSLSVSYLFVGAHHLPHPTDLNPQNTALLIQNFQRFANIAPPTRNAALGGVSIPTTIAAGTPFTNSFGVTCVAVIPGMIAQCPGGRVVAPAIANFFRPNSPNYFLAQALSGGAVTKAVLDSQLGGSLRTTGLVSPFGSVNAQVSDGNSSYNAMNVELKRRFANNFQFLATYTWSHSIDDSSDLQTLLVPQDVNNFRAEKANSLFDQRHRFVFSGVLTSPGSWRGGNGFQKFLSDFTVAPIIEVSSGRPFNIITNFDANVDQTGQTDRPSVNADGTLCIPGTTGCSTPLIVNGQFASGNLGRNAGLTRNYFTIDLGITRAIRFGERVRLDLIAQGFNLFNRFNEASVSPLFTDVNSFRQRASNGAYYSRSTAAYDPRQFQFGVKLNF